MVVVAVEAVGKSVCRPAGAFRSNAKCALGHELSALAVEAVAARKAVPEFKSALFSQ